MLHRKIDRIIRETTSNRRCRLPVTCHRNRKRSGGGPPDKKAVAGGPLTVPTLTGIGSRPSRGNAGRPAFSRIVIPGFRVFTFPRHTRGRKLDGPDSPHG